VRPGLSKVLHAASKSGSRQPEPSSHHRGSGPCVSGMWQEERYAEFRKKKENGNLAIAFRSRRFNLCCQKASYRPRVVRR
jgi:hypothetical protein